MKFDEVINGCAANAGKKVKALFFIRPEIN